MADELFKKDPATYAAMAVPFENAEAANVAIEAFHKELGELRRKYKITNLVGVASGEYLADGEPTTFMLPMLWGDAYKAEAMAAWLLGHEQAARQERVMSMLDNRKTIRKPAREK